MKDFQKSFQVKQIAANDAIETGYSAEQGWALVYLSIRLNMASNRTRGGYADCDMRGELTDTWQRSLRKPLKDSTGSEYEEETSEESRALCPVM